MVEIIPSNTCCFTGHRTIAPKLLLPASLMARSQIIRLCQQEVDTFLCGGALGFDTLAAQEVLRLRGSTLPSIRLVLVLPCLDQERLWPRQSQELYRDILRQADDVIYTGGQYTKGCMFTRNRYLVDHSEFCVCWLLPDTRRGGTLYTVNYAKKLGRTVITLPGRDALQSCAEGYR